jgi:hypothetical protein
VPPRSQPALQPPPIRTDVTHEETIDDDDPKPRHGGAIVIAGTYHVELVVKDGQVDVYLMGHDDKPVAVTGRKGVAILMVGGKSVRIPLEPVGSERLSGKATDVRPTAPKGVVQITEPAGGTVQARFN